MGSVDARLEALIGQAFKATEEDFDGSYQAYGAGLHVLEGSWYVVCFEEYGGIFFSTRTYLTPSVALAAAEAAVWHE